jgi:hypothetical protein
VKTCRHSASSPSRVKDAPRLHGTKQLETLLTDPVIEANLARASAHMRSRSGTEKAAALLDGLVRR